MRSPVRRRAFALLAAVFLALSGVSGVLADAPDPGSTNVSVSGNTVTVSGSWVWPGIDKCTDRWAGYAIDWDDPSDPGNVVKNGVSVGSANDNTVHSNGDCGVITSGKDRAGSWGPISHTYSAAGTYTVCPVTYDLHLDHGQPKADNLVAGGSNRNKDNSVEAGSAAPAGSGCVSVTVQTPASITARKTVNRTDANPGDTLTYTIALQNAGGTAGSVDVSDNISALLAKGTFQSVSNGGALNGSTVAWNNVNVPAGGSVNLTFSVRLNTAGWSAGTTNLPNTVVVPSTNCASGSSNTDCRTNTTVNPSVNLAVRKTVNKATAAPGDTLAYTITIQNTGSADATGVSASDNISGLLAKATFVSASGGGVLNGSTLGWSGLSVDAGATATLSFSVRLNTTGWPGGSTTFADTIVVPGSDCASGSSNANCKASTTVSTSANLVVRKTVNKATAAPGDTLAYTITVQNTGGADGTGVSVSDNISALLAKATFVSASNGGALNGSTLGWSGLSVDAGATASLSFSVRLNTAGWGGGTTTLANTVVVPNSDCASGSTNANCKATTTISTSANLVVRKSVNRTTAGPGDTLTYSITVQNTGGADATGVSVTDNISALLAKGSFVSGSGGGALSGSTVSWSNLSIDAGATASIGFSVRLDTSGWTASTSSFPNTVVVPNSDCASGSSNANCRVSTTVTTAAGLSVYKTVNKTSAIPGDTLIYTITVQNTGTADATGVSVTDNISTILAKGTFVSASNGGSLSGSVLGWNGLSINAGSTATLTFSVRLNAAGWSNGITTLTNVVVVAGSDCASGSTNADCKATTTVDTNAHLVVRKTVDKTSADPGDTLNYTIRIDNEGSADATNVDVTDNINALLDHGSFGAASAGGSLSGSVLSWPNLAVDAGATKTLTYSVRLDAAGWPSGTTNLPNAVVVTQSDCASGNSNAACRTSTSVAARATLVVRKSVNATSADPGDSLTYTITVQNTGNAPATGVDVTDDIGALLGHGSFVSASGGGALVGNSVRWTDVKIAPGTTLSAQFSVKLDVDGWSAGTSLLPNTVIVAGSDCASTSTNASCRVNTSVTPRFAISVTKGVGTGSSGPFGATASVTTGDTVWYQIKVTNTGNATLTGVKLTDSQGIPASQCAAIPTVLAPAALWTCTYFTKAEQGSSTNTATADSNQTGAVSDTASLGASLASAPQIHIVKSANPTSLPVGGANVTYSYVVTNPGNVALSDIGVTDDHCTPLTFQGGDTNTNNRLDTAETWRYTCGETVTVTTTNTATAAGSFGTTRVTDTDRLTVTVLVAGPAIHLEKTASVTSLPVGGGPVTYGYVVTNVGSQPLSSVGVTDDKCAPVRLASGDTNSNSRLDLTETWRFTCTATLTQTTTNHASVTASYTDIAVHDEAQATVTVATSVPGIRVVAAANPTSLPAGGGSVTYTYVVTNTGNAPLTTLALVDNRCDDTEFVSGDTNGNDRLDVGETWQYRCTTIVSATTTNTASVTGHAGASTVSDTDTTTVAVTASNAAISVVKTASPISLPAGGGPVTYTYNVTNKGNVPLSSVSLIDDVCPTVTATGGDTNANSRLDPTETWRYTCTQTLTRTTTNTALVTAFSAGLPVTDTDQALVTVGTPAALTPRVGLALTAAPVDLPPGGGPVTFTYIVTNKGDAPLATVSVLDDRCLPVTGPTGDVNTNGILDLAESWTFTCSLTLTQTATNMATASAAYLGQQIQAVDMATVTVAPPAPTPNPTAPSVGPIVPGDSGSPAASGGPVGPGSSGGTSGTSGGPGGSVAGATSPAKPSTGPGATVLVNTGSTPSGMVMILILLLGVAASVVIMTLSKRTSNS